MCESQIQITHLSLRGKRISAGSRIPQTGSTEGANSWVWSKNRLFGKTFAENCMEMQKLEPKDPPMQKETKNSSEYGAPFCSPASLAPIPLGRRDVGKVQPKINKQSRKYNIFFNDLFGWNPQEIIQCNTKVRQRL